MIKRIRIAIDHGNRNIKTVHTVFLRNSMINMSRFSGELEKCFNLIISKKNIM